MIFNPVKYNFWPICETIKKFYWPGVGKDVFHYGAPPRNPELDSIIADNIVDDNNFQERWVSFCNHLEKKFNKKIIGTTMGQLPCFNAYVELEQSKMNDLVRTKTLQFSVSLIGPFFSITGVDGNQITKEENRSFWSTNYIVVSPLNEYAELFIELELEIKERFKNFRLVPHEIASQKIEGLYDNSYPDSITVSNALFGGSLNFAASILGDPFYGYEHWIKEDYKAEDDKGGWTMYPNRS